MDVVINKCYGGFGLSSSAVVELIRRGSTSIQVQPAFKYFRTDPTILISLNLTEDPKWKRDFNTPIEDGFFSGFSGDVLYKEGNIYRVEDSSVRQDPVFISLMKEKGSKWCSGNYAELSIVSIPDDVMWEIDKYDGQESIHESHRSWG